jgi:hypothetical protein
MARWQEEEVRHIRVSCACAQLLAAAAAVLLMLLLLLLLLLLLPCTRNE